MQIANLKRKKKVFANNVQKYVFGTFVEGYDV